MCVVEVWLRLFLHSFHPLLHARIRLPVDVVATGDRLHHFADAEQISDADLIAGEIGRALQPDVLQVSGGLQPFVVPFRHGPFIDRFASHSRNDDLNEEIDPAFFFSLSTLLWKSIEPEARRFKCCQWRYSLTRARSFKSPGYQ